MRKRNKKMAKKFYSSWNLLLGSLIALLGFGSCKTAKKVQPQEETIVYYGPPPAKVIEKKDSIKVMKLLYGAPPVQIEKKSE